MRFKPIYSLILLFLYVASSYAQHNAIKFVIAPNNYFNDYSIDRIAQQIYADLYAGAIFKIDLRTAAVDSTGLHGMAPIFSNKRHLMVYGGTLYNLDKGTSYAITAPPESTGNTYGALPISFSPDGSNVTWTKTYDYPNPHPNREFIFSLKDSSFTPVDSTVWPYGGGTDKSSTQWSSDTSIVFPAGSNAIAEYFIGSRKIDTLISTGSLPIASFAYNTKYNILAYVIPDQNYQPEIRFYYANSQRDSLILSSTTNPNDICWGGSFGDLSWSPDGSKLGFIETYLTDPETETHIFFYSLDSNAAYKTSPCWSWDDYTYSLQWLNDDTLCYVNGTHTSIYGMNILPVIDAVNDNHKPQLPESFGIKAYPNPFNPSTRIVVTLPPNTNGVLSIYDVLGRMVREYSIKSDGTQEYSINWNGTNSNGERVASGAYLAVLKSGNINSENIKVTKLMYLK